MAVVIDKIDNTYAKVVWLGRDANESTYANPLSFLDGSYAIHPPNFQYDPRFKNRKFTRYDGKVHLFKKEIGLLPLGLINEAVELLNINSFNVKISNSISLSFNNDRYDESSIDRFIEEFSNKKFKPYYYQIDALKSAIKNKRVLFESPTGSGKSLIIYLIVRYLMWLHKNEDFKFLIMVPSITLVGQIFRDFKVDYGWNNLDNKVGLYHSDGLPSEYLKETLTKQIMISTYQSVKEIQNKNPEFTSNFNFVLLDEAHKAKKESKVIVGLLNSCKNAEYRFGLTGTVPKNSLFEKTLEGCFGKKQILVETKTLQDEGILSKCKVVKVEIPYTKESIQFIKTTKIKYNEEVELLRLNKSKLYSLTKLIRTDRIKTNQNTLVLCSNIENGELDDIVNHLKKYHTEFEVEVIHGGISAVERSRIINSIGDREGVIIVATYATMSTGVNIKKLHNCVLASSLKAFETIIQTVGRILRIHNSKELAILYDLVDDIKVKMRTGNMWRSYLNTHWKEREAYYIEKGFPIEYFRLEKEFDILNTISELSKSK